MSRNATLSLNLLIVAEYTAIALFTPTPWLMFAAFPCSSGLNSLRHIVLGRIRGAARSHILPQAAIGVVAFNLIAGLIFSAALLGVLYWLGQFWLSGVKVIVPIVAVFVAYKSTFPLLARSKQ
jgi:hypothetical protein